MERSAPKLWKLGKNAWRDDASIIFELDQKKQYIQPKSDAEMMLELLDKNSSRMAERQYVRQSIWRLGFEKYVIRSKYSTIIPKIVDSSKLEELGMALGGEVGAEALEGLACEYQNRFDKQQTQGDNKEFLILKVRYRLMIFVTAVSVITDRIKQFVMPSGSIKGLDD